MGAEKYPIFLSAPYAKYCGYSTADKANISSYPDVGEVSSWAVEAMQWEVGNGIISGKHGGEYLDPHGYATRAECATIIQRFLERGIG